MEARGRGHSTGTGGTTPQADPLPLRPLLSGLRQRTPQTPGRDTVKRLIGKREIMRYLGIRSQPTWTRYKRLGLPVIWTVSNHVVANSTEIDAWLRRVGGTETGSLSAVVGIADSGDCQSTESG